MVAVALLVRAGQVWRTRRQQRRSRFFPAAITPKPVTRDPFGKNHWEPVYHGDFPKKKQNSRQNSQAATGLGKFEAEPVYHGHHAFSDVPRAKTRDPFGENPSGTRLSWRSPQTKQNSRQNRRLATGGLGKTFWNAFIIAVSPGKSRAHAKTGDLRPKAWEKPFGNRLSWRSRNQERSDWRNLSDRRNLLDRRNHMDRQSRETSPRSIFKIQDHLRFLLISNRTRHNSKHD